MNLCVVILDHFDSFTYNLVQLVGEILGDQEIIIERTDVDFEKLKKLKPTHLILSPGFGHPADVDIFFQAIQYWQDKIPILGICLGHQAIGLFAGAKIIRAATIMHGKKSIIKHNGNRIFQGLPKKFEAGRYHSLIIDQNTFGNNLEVIAHTPEGEIMGICLKNSPRVIGLQFHPESILTSSNPMDLKNSEGMVILRNFLRM